MCADSGVSTSPVAMQFRPDRGELERDVRGDHGQRRGGDRSDAETDARTTGMRTGDEDQRAAGSHPSDARTGNPQRTQKMLVEGTLRLVEIDVAKRRIGRAAAADQDVVDRLGQPGEEAFDVGGAAEVECRGPHGVDVACGAVEALTSATGEDDARVLRRLRDR